MENIHSTRAYFYIYLPLQNVRFPTVLILKVFYHQSMAIVPLNATEMEMFLKYAPALDIQDFPPGSFKDSSGFLVGISGSPTRIMQDHGRLSRKSRRQRCEKSKLSHSGSNHILHTPEPHSLSLCNVCVDCNNSK